MTKNNPISRKSFLATALLGSTNYLIDKQSQDRSRTSNYKFSVRTYTEDQIKSEYRGNGNFGLVISEKINYLALVSNTLSYLEYKIEDWLEEGFELKFPMHFIVYQGLDYYVAEEILSELESLQIDTKRNYLSQIELFVNQKLLNKEMKGKENDKNK